MKTITFFLFLASTFSSQAQKIAYFNSVTPDIYMGFVGTYPTTFEKVKYKGHFQIRYDSRNRISTMFYFDTGEKDYSNVTKSASDVVRMFYDNDTCYRFTTSDPKYFANDANEMLAILKNVSNDLHYQKIVQFEGKIRKIYLLPEDLENNPLCYVYSYPKENQTSRTKMFSEYSELMTNGYMSELITVDPKTNISTITYFGLNSTQVEQTNGTYQTKQFRNKAGQLLYEYTLNKSGDLIDLDGEIVENYESTKYNDVGDIIELTYFDKNHKQVVNTKQVRLDSELNDSLVTAKEYATAVWANDGFGNNIKTSFYDENGKKMINECLGFHEMISTYNKTNMALSKRFYDTNNKMIKISSDGKVFAGWEKEYDKNDETIKDHYLGENNKPILINGVIYTYFKTEEKPELDQNPDIYKVITQSETYYDLQNKPTNDKSGAHKIQRTTKTFKESDVETTSNLEIFDLTGRFLGEEIIIEDEDANRMIYRSLITEDELLEESWYDLNRQKINYNGVHSRMYKYYPKDLKKYQELKEMRCKDKEGQPASGYDSVYLITNDIEKIGNRVEVTTKQYNIHNRLFSDATHAAIKIEIKYTNDENYKAYYDLDKNNKPFVNPDNFGVWFIESIVEDKISKITQYGIFDIEKDSENDKKRMIIFQTVEDRSKKNEFKIAYFGSNEKPVLSNYGEFHCSINKFSDSEDEISVAYFDVKNKPAVNTELGYHKIIKTHTEKSNTASISFFDAKNKPARMSFTVNDLGIENVSKIVYIYEQMDGVEEQTGEKYYDSKGILLAEKMN